MPNDLDQLKQEIPEALQARGLTVFHSLSRSNEEEHAVLWDTQQHPDFREFVDCAEKLGIKILAMYSREFTESAIHDVQAELEDASLQPNERRELERRLKALLPYTGFTSSIELSFDYEGILYLYEVRSEFFDELLTIMGEVEDATYPGALDEEDGEDDEGPRGGFFSRN